MCNKSQKQGNQDIIAYIKLKTPDTACSRLIFGDHDRRIEGFRVEPQQPPTPQLLNLLCEMLLNGGSRLLSSHPLHARINPGNNRIIIKNISSANRGFALGAVNVDWFIFFQQS